MRSNLDELIKELDDLKALIASIAPVNSALSEHQDLSVRRYLTIRRRFDYGAFVVALYAAFEQFIENLAASYARTLCFRHSYEALPDALKGKHLTKSAEILSRSRLGEGRYSSVREIDLVKNLFDCLSGASPFSLNNVAIIAHDSNLRFSEVSKLFEAVGISQVNEAARKAASLKEWYRTSRGLENLPQVGVPIKAVQEKVDDLVERRNEVSHRGAGDNLLGSSEMSEMVTFVESFARALFSKVVAEYLKGQHVQSGTAHFLRLLEGPYKNGTVVVIEKPKHRLYLQQPVFELVESGVRWGRILDLKMDDISVSSVEENSDVRAVGLQVSFTCTNTPKLYTLAAEDDVVWPPLMLDGLETKK